MTRFKALIITTALCVVPMLPVAATAAERVVVVVKVYPAAGREDELQARFLQQIAFVRKAEPTASFRLHRSAKTPTTFLWYETFETLAAHEHHLKVVMPSFRKEFGPVPEGSLTKPPEVERFVELAE